YTQTTWSCR
ncbi:hypothetical protein VCHC64A1_03224B, partial [Vibrio cholerae HC-64A1]